MKPAAPIGRLARDDGNAVVEFVVLGVALLIPSLYLVLTLGSVQSAVFAADVLARDAARIHAVVPDSAEARDRTQTHSGLVLDDFGLSAENPVTITCSEDPCSAPGGSVTAEVAIPVPVPGLGPLFDEQGIVTVRSEHTILVDEHRGIGS